MKPFDPPLPLLLFRIVDGGGVRLAPWLRGGGGGKRVALGSFGIRRVGGAKSAGSNGKSLGILGSINDVVLAVWSMKNICNIKPVGL